MPDKRKDANDSSAASQPKKSKSDTAAEATDTLTYDPVHFIRSHSKNNDPADIQTQVTLLCSLLIVSQIGL